MRRGTYAAALLSAAVLVLAVWVTNTESIDLFPDSSTSQPAPPAVATTVNQDQHAHHKPQPPPPKPTPNTSTLGPVGYLVLGAIALALLAFVASAVVQHERRARRFRPPEADESMDAIDALDVPPQLREAAERQLLAIREGSPRNAIVACWMELERTCSESGFPRARAETSTEFTARVLAHYAVRPETVGALAALYREARFSEHRLAEPDRERAVSALEQILADLRQPARPDATAVPSA